MDSTTIETAARNLYYSDRDETPTGPHEYGTWEEDSEHARNVYRKAVAA